jgi:hypothetical protein
MDAATLRFAKILTNTGEACGLDKDSLHQAIEKLAMETKRADESLAQAYSRTISEPGSDGALLFKAYKLAPEGKKPVQAAQSLKPEPIGEASAELERTARAMAKEKRITYQQAYSRLISDPERRELLERVKAEERAATGRVADSRWPLRSAEEQSRTRQWVDELDAVGRRRFRPDAQ